MSLPKISFFNTLSAKKETFKSNAPGHVNIYACGPTVYNYTHIGNARASITPDFILRVFQLAGYNTKYLSNITDIDDKIIKASQEEGLEISELSKKFENAYLAESKQLNNKEPDLRPRATEHVAEMIEMISKLIEKDFAYPADTPFGQDVYFRVSKFPQYGKLSKRKVDDLIAGSRIEPGEMKENPVDFAMWKSAKPGEPSWDSPWGKGRPGWHIECSAMIQKHFPNGIDIHMGGLDLIFPHHENEIAQSECCNNQVFAPYWIHNGMLTIEREKMSKSLGNFFLTKDFLEQFGPETLRLMLLQQHYRSPIDFSHESILRTEAMVERLYHGKQILIEKGITPSKQSNEIYNQMQQALFDDFNSAKALGFLLKGLRQAFKLDSQESWQQWASGYELFTQAFGLGDRTPENALSEMKKRRYSRSGKDSSYCESVEKRLEQRKALREGKEFDAADTIRQELEAEGVLIMDGPDGTAWQLRSGS